jgi:excisionase family DNA binding protein
MSSQIVTAREDVLFPLLSINEVGELLGISRPTVYALIRRGELAPIRVGERLRFEQADVRAYLERHRESASEMREAGFPASEPLADENVDGNSTPDEDIPRLGLTEEFLVQYRALAPTAPEPWRSRLLDFIDEATEDDDH